MLDGMAPKNGPMKLGAIQSKPAGAVTTDYQPRTWRMWAAGFGGTLSLEDAFALGFDHVALCAGAGKPTVLDLSNGISRGVRTASEVPATSLKIPTVLFSWPKAGRPT